MIVKTEDNRSFSVDPLTGEVYGEYEIVESTNKEETQYYKSTTFNPSNARNTDEIEEFIKATIDKRKLITINNIQLYHDRNCGEIVRSGAKNQFTLPAYKIMVKLVNALTIHNCLICTQDYLGSVLGCESKDIKRTLKACKSLVRYDGNKGMQKGFVKVFINPAYGWKGDSSTAYHSQRNAIADWYKESPDLLGEMQTYHETCNIEFTEDTKDWLMKFSKNLKPFSDYVYEDQAEFLVKS
jgi:hypothetical protein